MHIGSDAITVVVINRLFPDIVVDKVNKPCNNNQIKAVAKKY